MTPVWPRDDRRPPPFPWCMDTEIDLEVARIAEEHHGVFAFHHLEELRVTGYPRSTARLRTLGGAYDRVYRVGGAPRSWKGDCSRHAGQAAIEPSHRTVGGRVWELPGSRREIAEITCPRWRRAQHDGLVVHEITRVERAGCHDRRRDSGHDGRATIFDLAAVCSRFTVDLAIDSALRQELTTVDALGAMLRRVGRRGLKGTRLLRGLLADRDANYAPTESEREQMLLRVLREHGLPEPERQYLDPRRLRELPRAPDLVYRDFKIAMEYDSYQHHVGKQAHVRDSRRRNAIAAIGWRHSGRHSRGRPVWQAVRSSPGTSRKPVAAANRRQQTSA